MRELRGGALSAEFERASDALSATLAFQADQAVNNTRVDDDILPRVRVGIAMGEVVIADNTVTGGRCGVGPTGGAAGRAGGLCITGAINEALPTRMPFDQESLGERKVKGFDEPVRVYRVTLKAGEIIPAPGRAQKTRATSVLGISAAVSAIALLVAAGAAYGFQPWFPEEEPASVEHMAVPLPENPPLDLPGKPSIAVLPFINMSGNPEQEYLADGITEDVITELSRFKGLFVISRTSSFAYKDKSVKVQEIGRELGVRYLLEGSVRRSGNDLRITAQLIEARTGRHIWAEKYGRQVDDVFAIQDEINGAIVTTLGETLRQAAAQEVARKSTSSFEAYDYCEWHDKCRPT